MTSIALAVFIIFVIYVMVWSIRNDGIRSIGEQTGFIRMRVPPKADDAGNAASARVRLKPPGPTAGAKKMNSKVSPSKPRTGGKQPPAAGHRPPPGPRA